MCTKNHNIWCTVPETRSETDWIFCNFGWFYSLLPTPNNPNNQNFEKNLKKCLEVLSFYRYMCTINVGHMIYESWNIRYNRQIFSSFWAIFCLFSPLTTSKIKILKLKKTPRDIIILHICTINYNDMMYVSWGMERDRRFFVILDRFLPFYTPMDLENQSF